MSASEAIVAQWFARTAESYPELMQHFLATERDQFRNPVGHTLRESLAALVQQLLGEMDAERIAAALEPIIRLRAVQDFTPSQAVWFVFLLKPIIREPSPDADPAMLDSRIDQLALMAFDQYMNCREQIAQLRVNESRRTLADRSDLLARARQAT